MDVKCRSCGEPWDTYHLRHDEVYETDLPNPESFDGSRLSTIERDAFKKVGWTFGSTVLNVKRCPCCKPEDTEQDNIDVVEDLFGDDLDGLASFLDELD